MIVTPTPFENATFEQARKKYGLAKEMSEGATLHAWEWSFKTIEENIPENRRSRLHLRAD